MKLLKKTAHQSVYDYDEDARDFCKFLDKNFKRKMGCKYRISKDDGSNGSGSGYLIFFDSEMEHVTAMDLLKIWKFVEK